MDSLENVCTQMNKNQYKYYNYQPKIGCRGL